MNQKPEVIEHWINTVNEEGRNLTKWELDFMESITEQFKVRNWISDRQEENLRKGLCGENFMIDTRFVYGACCSWMGSITQVKVNNFNLPCCPYCYGVLLEFSTKQEFMKGVDEFEIKHPGYKKFLEWNINRKSCSKTLKEAIKIYNKETNSTFDLPSLIQ